MKRTLPTFVRIAAFLLLVFGSFAFVPLGSASEFFLHSSTNDFLDNTGPIATTAKIKDSTAVNRTTYREIGTWAAAPTATAIRLNSLSDLHVWIGLKNSDDQGTYFDLRAELRKNGMVIASGETKDIHGVTRNPDNARELTVTFGAVSNDRFNPGDVLSLRILTKVADSGGHGNAVGLCLYYDAVSRASRFGAVFAGVVNEAPVATNDAYNTDEDTPLSGGAPGVLGNDNDADDMQSTLTAALVNSPLHAASFVLNVNGSFSYTPSANFNGTDIFTYRAQDPHGARSNLATVTIAVNPINDAPVAVNDAYNTNEDSALSVLAPGVLGNDNDIDTPASSLTAVLVAGPSHAASFTLNSNGSFSYTPAANFNGADTFTYKANDGISNSNVAMVTIAINQVNDAPVASNDAYNTDEDTPLSIPAPGVLGNDNDIDTPQSSLTAILVAGPSHAADFTLNSDGSFNYTPTANFNGVDTFTYKANDGSLDSNVAMATITINPINDAPVAANDTYTIDEDTTLRVTTPGVLANDNDTDTLASPLTVQLVSSPVHAANFQLNADGSFSYTPAQDFNGTDTFTYRVFDGALYSNVAMAQISIAAVNDAPVAQDQSLATNEDTPENITLSASDIDSQILSFSIVANPSHGMLGIISATNCAANGAGSNCTATVTYTPAADFNGTDSFTFKANDGSLDSNVATVSITVSAVNDAPLANNAAAMTDENTAVSITLSASDIDSTVLNFTVTSGPSHGSLNITSGTMNCNIVQNGTGTPGSNCTAIVTYTPEANYNGSDSFTFTVNDGDQDSNIGTVSVTVNAVNDAPLASDAIATTDEDMAVAITLSASDIDSPSLSFSIVAGPSNGSLGSITTPTCAANGAGINCTATVNYSPAANYNGPDSFTFKANDGSLDSNVATVGITVNAVNDAPVATNDFYNTDEDMPLNLFPPGVLGNDNDVDDAQSTLTAALVSGPLHAASFTLNVNGSFSYMPSANFNGVDTFTYLAQDPHDAQSNLATVTITIYPVNAAPTANNATATTNSGTAVSIALNANDIDSPSLSFAVGNSPTHGSLDITSGTMTCSTVQNGTTTPGSNCTATVTYTPTGNYSGADSFTFTVNDGQATSNAATVSITVKPQTFRVTITSPIPGSTVNAATVLVRGVVDVPVGTEVGVSVNGFLAAVHNGAFVVLVQVTPETTSLTAVATTAAGATGSDSISISVSSASAPAFTLLVSPASGVAPLAVAFSLLGSANISAIELDFEGDGTMDFTGQGLQGRTFTYTQPGIYIPTVRVTDAQGNLFTANAVVQVFDADSLDGLLQAKWNIMKDALQRGDIETALQVVAAGIRDRYRPALQVLAGDLPGVVSTLGDLQVITFQDGLTEAATVRLEDGQRRVYFIYFVPDNDGIWRILGM